MELFEAPRMLAGEAVMTVGEVGLRGHRTTAPAAAEAVRPSRLTDVPRSQPLRYERFRSETAGSLAVAYEAVSPRRSPLCLSDSGAALIGPLLVAALDRAARVFSQPDATARPSKTCNVVSDGSHLAGVVSRNEWGTAVSSSSLQNAAEKI